MHISRTDLHGVCRSKAKPPDEGTSYVNGKFLPPRQSSPSSLSKVISPFAKHCLLLFFIILFSPPLISQNQTLADSLEAIYALNKYKKPDKLKILKELAVNHTDTEKKLRFSEELIQAAQTTDSTNYLIQGILEKGNAYRLKSDYSKALESYFQGATITIEENLNRRLGTIYIAIADVYSIMGNHPNAGHYYTSAIDILRAEDDSISLASALLNAGDEYFNYGELDSALLFFQESGDLFRALNYEIGVAYNQGNIGLVYAELGKNRQAEKNIHAAIATLDELGDYYPISVYLTYMSDIYMQKGDSKKALDYAFESLELSKKHGLKKQIGDANFKLSEIYEQTGVPAQALKYYKDFIEFRDSVKNIESIQKIAELRTDFEISRKQIEVNLLNQQKRTQQIIVIAVFIALFLIGLLALGLYRRYKFIEKTTRIIQQEKNRSENLLLNILPEETAKELKEFGKVKAQRFESVTVLFTDFKEFTQYAEKSSPEKLVESVDFYFSKFDEIIGKYGLEKIKTVGDAYMCAGGLPYPSKDHAEKILLAAFEIVAFVNATKQQNDQDKICFDIRIGINTGPVIAGVVGTKKFQYDIWGDTVNIASRMESHGESGKINISHHTYNLVKDRFSCSYRGEVQAKGKGLVKMYFAEEQGT